MAERPGETMACREFVELVTDYLEGRLTAEQEARFRDHLDLCPGCQVYVEQMRGTLAALGRIPEESISSEAREELLSAFRDWHADAPI